MILTKAKYKNIMSEIRRNKSVCFNLAIRFQKIDNTLAFNYLNVATFFYMLIEAIETNEDIGVIVRTHPYIKDSLYAEAKAQKNPHNSVAYYLYKFYDLSEQIYEIISNRRVVN